MYICDFLRSRGVWFEPLLHRPASSSTKLAGSIHEPGRRVAKTVLIKAGDQFVLAILPATLRIDLARLGDAVVRRTRRCGWRPPTSCSSSFQTASPASFHRSASYTGSRRSSIRAGRGARDRRLRQHPPRRDAHPLSRLPEAGRADARILHFESFLSSAKASSRWANAPGALVADSSSFLASSFLPLAFKMHEKK